MGTIACYALAFYVFEWYNLASIKAKGISHMISRYSRPEMSAIWSEESKFQIWFEIEAHACDAQAKLGVIPPSAAATIWKKGAFNINRINEIERETKHDVIAFLTNLAEYIGEEARFVHQGMTSSDILDTTLSVQMARASDLLIEGIDRLLTGLKKTRHRT